jgi:hypothetical protein
MLGMPFVYSSFDEHKLLEVNTFHNKYIRFEVDGVDVPLLDASTFSRLVHENCISLASVCSIVKNLLKSRSKTDQYLLRRSNILQRFIDEGWASQPDTWTYWVYEPKKKFWPPSNHLKTWSEKEIMHSLSNKMKQM